MSMQKLGVWSDGSNILPLKHRKMKIIPFSQIEEGQESLVGIKGASLGRLIRDKLPVPVGYVISSAVFEEFIASNKLNALISSELEKVNLEDLHSVDYASRVLQDLILSAPISQEAEMEILQQFTHINSEFAAVRSSVYSEDGRSAPWAGELVTRLQVPAHDVSDRVKECWASLFSTRSIYFLLQKQLDPLEIKFAVIVEQMYEAHYAGVAYSVHPLSRDKNQLVIEAGLGVGESEGNPEMTPDTYVIQKEPFKIISSTISKQEIKEVLLSDGGVEIEEAGKDGEEQKLTDEQIETLTHLVQAVETAFQEPTEIEWVFRDEFFIVQTRKISSLS